MVVPLGHMWPRLNTLSRSGLTLSTCPSCTRTSIPHIPSHKGHVRICTCSFVVIIDTIPLHCDGMHLSLAKPLPFLYAQKWRSEEHTSELQSLMRISYAVFCLK